MLFPYLDQSWHPNLISTKFLNKLTKTIKLINQGNKLTLTYSRLLNSYLLFTKVSGLRIWGVGTNTSVINYLSYSRLYSMVSSFRATKLISGKVQTASPKYASKQSTLYTTITKLI